VDEYQAGVGVTIIKPLLVHLALAASWFRNWAICSLRPTRPERTQSRLVATRSQLGSCYMFCSDYIITTYQRIYHLLSHI
jgi:hypothetical protein